MYRTKEGIMFFDCIAQGDLKQLQVFIDSGFNINFASKEMYSPIMYAVLQGRIDVVELLVKNGADLNLIGPNSESALDIANNHYEHFRRQGVTNALSTARKVRTFLLNKGAKTAKEIGVWNPMLKESLDKQEKALFNRVRTIAQEGKKEKLACFIDTKLAGYVDSVIMDVIVEEAQNNDNPRLIEVLREKYANLMHQDEQGNTYLHKAVEAGSLKVVEALLNAEVDELVENYDGNTPFQTAVEKEKWDVVKAFFDHKAVDEKDPQNMLMRAVNRGDVPLAHMVLELNGVELDLKRAFITCLDDKNDLRYLDKTIDCKKANLNRAQIATCILEAGFDAKEVQLEDGQDLISYVLNDYRLHPLLPKLVNQGVDIDSVAEKRGDTPLTLAIKNGADEFAKYLIDNGADIEQAETQGLTPLMLASGRGDRPMLVSYLLEKGAQVETKTPQGGKTALTFAAENGNFIVVKHLLGKVKEIKEDGIDGLMYLEKTLAQNSYAGMEEIKAYFSGVRAELKEKKASKEGGFLKRLLNKALSKDK